MKDSSINIIDSATILNCKVFDVSRHRISENGQEYERDIVEHSGSAVVLPVHDNGDITLVRQYRHAASEYLLEIPAGTIESNETSEECAFREIEEETGYRTSELKKISEFFVSPGYITEKMHLFTAGQLVKTQQNLDIDENIEIVRLTLGHARDLVADGTIVDAKTIIGILLVSGAGPYAL